MKDEIIKRLENGQSYRSIAKELKCARSTISYHAIKHGLGGSTGENSQNKYDWKEIQKYYDENENNVRACMRKFGFFADSWYRAIARGDIVLKEKTDLEIHDWLLSLKSKNRHRIKHRLISEGIVKNECSKCNTHSIWNNEPLIMVLDHINGVANDHRLENLRLLCPNCNSQTETFSGRNTAKQRQKRNNI